ncbi:glycerol-3-phosphate 1-O-acyltransferase PlsY [Domibacillus iocasae]|uniref:Glycerol-3-phosphate acyltransferase n=1 Tax=Domibacillus iocasae TaxID=1714016 RepID=A0A1E7DRA2_9BACI|nr:glycerol-3-phosphate 1-O-acyltransferase PlsY [Domibacillus iocasae]OES45594.1 glycerol-3-phosphate acyltransferase [Domibacillus iocasae]
MIPALILIIAYLLGSIPSGLIAGRAFFGIDIREHGSGNLGATNSFRVLGKKAGAFVTAADILKGTAATLIPISLHLQGVVTGIHPLLAGLFAVIGHMFPLFAGFRGGKAVATSAGVLLAYSPLFFLLLATIFVSILLITKYVSVASVSAAVAAFIYAVVHTIYEKDYPFFAVVVALAFFVIYRHRANIVRLRNGTEPKVSSGKSK